MGCEKVREQILRGRGNRRGVRVHLGSCLDCQAFRLRLEKAEVLIASALPFEAAELLSRRLQSLVPRAARDLRASARGLKLSAREIIARRVLYGCLAVAIPLAIALGVYLWREGPALFRPWIDQVGAWLPLLPAALYYWGGRLVQSLAPIREALLFVLSFALLGLSLEKALRAARLRPAAGNSVSH